MTIWDEIKNTKLGTPNSNNLYGEMRMPTSSLYGPNVYGPQQPVAGASAQPQTGGVLGTQSNLYTPIPTSKLPAGQTSAYPDMGSGAPPQGPTGPNVTTQDQQNREARAGGLSDEFIPGTAAYNAKMQQDAAGGGVSGQPQEDDFSSLIAGPMQALNEQAQFLQGLLPTQAGQAKSSAANLMTQAQQTEASGLAQYGGQKVEAQGARDTAISEARRQAAEVQRGVQSRYGGTTGTGAFVGEQAGVQAMRNIQAFHTSFQNTLGKIQEAESNLKATIGQKLFEITQGLEETKVNLQNELKSALLNINLQRGQLESKKAEARLSALDTYRTLIADQQKQAKLFEQQIKLKSIDTQNALNEIKARNEANLKEIMTRANVKAPAVAQEIYTNKNGQLSSMGTLPARAKYVSTSSGNDWFTDYINEQSNIGTGEQPASTTNTGDLTLEEIEAMEASLPK